MNKIIAIAMLALCACVSAKVTFTPYKLPCEYTIVEESNSTVALNDSHSLTNTIRVHGTFAVMTSEEKTPNPVFKENLVRIDIADYMHDKVTVFQIDTSKSETCDQGLADRLTVLDEIDSHYLKLFKSPSEFDSVTDGKFEGISCKVYYKKVNETVEYLFADKDSFVIGYNFTSGDHHRISRFKYDMKAPLDKFVVNVTKYPGCSQYSAVVPVVDECVDIEFQAHELPCEFTIDAHNDYVDHSGTEYVVDAQLIAHGDFKQRVIKQKTPITYEGHTILRTDINTTNTFTVFESSSMQGTCKDDVVNREIVADRVKEALAVFQDKWIFHAKADGQFQDKPCTMYYRNTNGTELIFFVDKDNYVIGLNTTSVENTQTSSFSYSMKAPLNLFVIDKKFKGCSSPAYTLPKYSPCGDYSAASTVLVSFVLLFAAIMFALF